MSLFRGFSRSIVQYAAGYSNFFNGEVTQNQMYKIFKLAFSLRLPYQAVHLNFAAVVLTCVNMLLTFRLLCQRRHIKNSDCGSQAIHQMHFLYPYCKMVMTN